MSKVGTIVLPQLSLRLMVQRDLPHVVQIEQETVMPCWDEEDFLKVFLSGDTAGWVADAGNRVVGFLIYTVGPQPEVVDLESSCLPEYKYLKEDDDGRSTGLCLTLLNLAVARGWRRRGIARMLLNRLEQKLQPPVECIQVPVPESNLALQMLLRKVGYRAVGILRGHFGAEDAYLLEKQRR